MHHDQKVGLALGVLLIGAVAAFFFRNEAEPAARIPTLQNPEDVNREISERRLTPYIPEPETPAASLKEHPPAASENDPRTGERTLTSVAATASDGDTAKDPFQIAAPEQTPAPAPDPIRVAEPAAVNPPGDEISETAGNSEPNTDSPPLTEPVVQIHEVQKGETLSSIAGKYLGSQARYQDVFEANRDQLRNPNDLQVGMKLKIPSNKPGSAANVPAVPVKPAGHQTVSAEPISVETPRGSTTITEQAPRSQHGDDLTTSIATDLKGKFTPSKRRPISGNNP